MSEATGSALVKASGAQNAHSRALSEFCLLWERRYGAPYIPDGSDKSQLGRILNELPPELVDELPRMFARYLADPDPWITQKPRHSLRYFCTNGNGVNKYRTTAIVVTERDALNHVAGQQWLEATKETTNGVR